MAKCAICGRAVHLGIEAYQAHYTQFHNVAPVESKAKGLPETPRSLTGRSKAQIVEGAEMTWLSPHIITDHITTCRCGVCVNIKLAELLAKSEAVLSAMVEN